MKPPKAVGKAGGEVEKMAKNPKVLAGAAGLVVVLALFSKRNANAATSAGTPTTATGQIVPGQGGTYDSTANDVYNSLMGQIQALGLAQGQSSGGASTPTPTPNPGPTVVPKPAPPVVQHAPAPKPSSRPKTPPRPKPAPQTSYTVQRGDSLSTIAGRFGIKDWKSLYAANTQVVGPNPNRIFAGEKLRIPGR